MFWILGSVWRLLTGILARLLLDRSFVSCLCVLLEKSVMIMWWAPRRLWIRVVRVLNRLVPLVRCLGVKPWFMWLFVLSIFGFGGRVRIDSSTMWRCVS